MQRHALLINTARGALVDSKALVEALKTAAIAGAGIDVLPEEPPVNGDPLLDYLHAQDQASPLIVTPHIAWAARQARQRALDQVLENIQAFAAGKELRRLC
jgi:glycerate dehydrogenase